MNIFKAVTGYLIATQGLNQEWEAYRVSVLPEEAPAGQIKIWGAVAPRLKRNPALRDWRRKDPETVAVFFVNKEALKEWEERGHRTNNTCPDCNGKGYRAVGWSNETGTKTTPCTRCNETGEYKEASNG